jgi:hypothetical protein
MQSSAEAYATLPKKWIHTNGGRKFFIDEPQFHIEEVAHALSMQCRFSGHVPRFYSVAEHSVLVSRLCFEIVDCQRSGEKILDIVAASYEGLLHDAHEAYFLDMPSPWKSLVPEYCEIEHRLETQMRECFGLPNEISSGVKLADWYALFIEAAEFFPKGTTDDWPVPADDFREKVAPIIASRYFAPRGMSPTEASRVFTARAHKLAGGLPWSN